MIQNEAFKDGRGGDERYSHDREVNKMKKR